MQPLTRPVPAALPELESWLTVGVTGTKGKSSTTALVAAALGQDGHPVFSATTLAYRLGERELDKPADWQAFLDLAVMAGRAGCRRAALELTSKVLSMGHAKRWRVDIGVFTNLSEDHLSTHGSWEHYLASKAQLFVHLGPGCKAVLNACDPACELLDRVIPADVERLWYGVPSRGDFLQDRPLALAAEGVEISVDGTRVQLRPSAMAEQLGGVLEVATGGEVFAENALAAATAALAAGISGSDVASGISAARPLPGRFEVVAREPLVIVDYAHAPDALRRICESARRLAAGGRLIVVFGAGGGTDRGKRAPMGAAVAAQADLAIITDDNARDEDPRAIAGDLMAGARGGRAKIVCELDRRAAIEEALAAAAAGDLVLIAGKGHERGQTRNGVTEPFSDREVVLEILQRRLGAAVDSL